jgi:hypothetical protein
MVDHHFLFSIRSGDFGPNGVAEEPCNTCDACVAIRLIASSVLQRALFGTSARQLE